MNTRNALSNSFARFFLDLFTLATNIYDCDIETNIFYFNFPFQVKEQEVSTDISKVIT